MKPIKQKKVKKLSNQYDNPRSCGWVHRYGKAQILYSPKSQTVNVCIQAFFLKIKDLGLGCVTTV